MSGDAPSITLWGGIGSRPSRLLPVADSCARMHVAIGSHRWHWAIVCAVAAFEGAREQNILTGGLRPGDSVHTRRTLLANLTFGLPLAAIGTRARDQSVRPEEPTSQASSTDSAGQREIFSTAEWLWGAIPAEPVLDPLSDTWAAAFATGAHILNTYDYGVPVFATHDASGARRPGSWQSISVTHTHWGRSPFADFNPIWMPADAAPSPQSDAAMVIVDPVRELTFELWEARRDLTGHWTAGWGGVLYLHGRGNRNTGGRETGQQGATGAGISRRAGLLTREDIAAGVVDHALVLSTDLAAPRSVRPPATKDDGKNLARIRQPIPEAARVQLDPSADLTSLSGYQLIIARALQVYGAYVIDNGGARVALIGEGHDPAGPRVGPAYFSDSTPVPGNPVYDGSTFWESGMRSDTGGYQSLADIPWDRVRVLARWDGR